MVLANIPFDFEKFLGVPLLFNLTMVSESEIEEYLQNNLPINNANYYWDHDPGSNIFTIGKQPTIESVNSEMVLNDVKIKLKHFLNTPLMFDLNMTSESEIEDWPLRYFPIDNTKNNYYIKHEKVSDLYVIRSARKNSKLIKELININRLIGPLVFVGVPLRFDLDEGDEIEIDNHLAKSIKYYHARNLTHGVFYTLDHEIGSYLFIIRRVN